MQLTHILGALGVTVSLVFGTWGVVLMLRRRYPGEITIVLESCIGLFEDIVRNLPDLSVLYHGDPVSEGLVFLKASFLNSGKKDISPAMVEEELTLSLPDGFRWLSANIVDTSPKVQATIALTDSTLVFDTGLFRCGEYIRFEALVEVPIGKTKTKGARTSIAKSFWVALSPTHRIADTQKVSKELLPRSSRRSSPLKLYVFTLCFLLGIVLASATFYHFSGWPAQTNYLMPTDSGNMIEVEVKSYVDDRVRVRGVSDKNFKKTMTEAQFFSTEKLSQKLVPDKEEWYGLCAIFVLFVLVSLPVCLMLYRVDRKRKRLRRLLGIPDDTEKKLRTRPPLARWVKRS